MRTAQCRRARSLEGFINGQSSASIFAAVSNRVKLLKNVRRTSPVGPLRCLAMSRFTGWDSTGWRASEAFFYAWLMDWKQISVYDGGWYEWSSDPKNPTVTGERQPAKS